MTSTPTVRVVVTGVGGGGFGEQLVKALRLGELDYQVHGTDIVESSYGFNTVDRAHVLPRADEPDYLEAVLDMCDQEAIEVLLPGSEAELLALSAHRDRLSAAGLLVPISPASVIETCMDKFRTFDWLRQNGFAVPDTRLISSEEDLRSVDFVPAVLKPNVGGGGSANLLLAQTGADVQALGRYMLATIGPFVVQEYLGPVDSEFTVGVLADMDGVLVDSIAVRRDISTGLSNRIKVANQTGNEALGPVLAISSGVSQGDVGRFPEVATECERIAESLGTRGAINIQCRLVNGRPHVFEINPRFSGTTSLRAMVGFNEPDWLIRRHLRDEPLAGRLDYRSARVLRGLAEQIVSSDGKD